MSLLIKISRNCMRKRMVHIDDSLSIHFNSLTNIECHYVCKIKLMLRGLVAKGKITKGTK